MHTATQELLSIPAGTVRMEGMLELPPEPRGMVLFAHGSGSSRHSPRNNFVAIYLRRHGLGTLLLDLLTPEEDRFHQTRFNIELLSDRLGLACDWLAQQNHGPIYLFGASTGAAAALQQAAARVEGIAAIVARGGRPDLAGDAALAQVRSPTLFIVGGDDGPVIELNEQACARLHCEKELVIVPGAGHLFEEPGMLEQVAELAQSWFNRH